MSFFDNYQFFCVLILILLPALLLGILEQPLKWYSTAATILFTALAFFFKTGAGSLPDSVFYNRTDCCKRVHGLACFQRPECPGVQAGTVFEYSAIDSQ